MKKFLYMLMIALCFFPLPIKAEEPTASPEGEKPPEAQAAQAAASASAEAEVTGKVLDLNAESVVLMDRSSGKILYEVNSDSKRDQGSLSKMMTVYLAENALTSSQTLRMSQTAFNTYDHSTGVLWIQIDEEMTAESAEYATMLVSSNDTAAMLAEAVTLNQNDFVAQMNAQASSWGLSNTNFSNIFGSSDGNQYSSAEDIALMTRQMLKDESFMKIFGAENYTIPATNRQTQSRALGNDCELLRTTSQYYQSDVIGGKIAGTRDIGYSLVACSEKSGSSIIAVVLGTESTQAAYEDVIKLLEYGFSQYQTVKISASEIGEKTVEVLNSDGKHYADAVFYVDSGFEALLPSDVDASSLKAEIQIENEDSTKVEDITGKVVFSINGTVVGSSQLKRRIVEYDVSFQATTLPLIQQVFDYISIGVLAFIVLFPLIVKGWAGLKPPQE